MAKSKNIILGVTGSIAAYKSADILRRLMEKSFEVTVVMTKEAEEFITPLTLSALSGKRVYRGGIKDDDSWQMPHIRLAESADLILVAPATANIIGKMANGLADDLLTCILLATKAPVVLAPAMNTEMYLHKIVQDNCAKLKKIGVDFVEPSKGKLACGTVGQGHIADEEDILKAVFRKTK